MIDILPDSKGSSEHVSPNDMLTPADSKNCLNCVCQDRDWRGGGGGRGNNLQLSWTWLHVTSDHWLSYPEWFRGQVESVEMI